MDNYAFGGTRLCGSEDLNKGNLFEWFGAVGKNGRVVAGIRSAENRVNCVELGGKCRDGFHVAGRKWQGKRTV
jgi:hypothetical protein